MSRKLSVSDALGFLPVVLHTDADAGADAIAESSQAFQYASLAAAEWDALRLWPDRFQRLLMEEQSKELLEEHGPSSIGFYTTGQLFLEEYYTLALIGHGGIGTNHMSILPEIPKFGMVTPGRIQFGYFSPGRVHAPSRSPPLPTERRLTP